VVISSPPQSSSASRFTAGASGFFILSQSGERPEAFGHDAFEPELAGMAKHEDGGSVFRA
jgi:hypothetical protein